MYKVVTIKQLKSCGCLGYRIVVRVCVSGTGCIYLSLKGGVQDV